MNSAKHLTICTAALYFHRQLALTSLNKQDFFVQILSQVILLPLSVSTVGSSERAVIFLKSTVRGEFVENSLNCSHTFRATIDAFLRLTSNQYTLAGILSLPLA